MTRPQYKDKVMYQQNPGASVETLHHKNDRDGAESGTSDYSTEDRGKVLVCITFMLEAIILAAVVVLEYFLRWTTAFPIRKQNFTCDDPEISLTKNDPSFSSFAFNAAVPTTVIYCLSFCIPPFVMLIGEIGVWAFANGERKSVRVCCRPCKISQVIRRLIRFIAVFAFGMFTLMIFVDVIKLVTGRLRPNFLEVCGVNRTLCGVNGNWGGDELCTNKDELEIRHARGSFPSLKSAMTAFAAVYLAIYIHGALRTRSVRVLRPFLSLVFAMLALLCGLTQMGLNQNYWTDVIAGFALGIVMAIYLGAFVLYNFREYVSERKMIRLLHGFLVDHQLLNEITKDGKLRLFPFPFHIPRAHTRPYQKFEGIKAQNAPLPIYGETEGPEDRYRDRALPHPGHPEEHGLSHL